MNIDDTIAIAQRVLDHLRTGSIADAQSTTEILAAEIANLIVAANVGETVATRIARMQLTDIKETRLETLTIAHPLVDDATFAQISNALRVSRKATVILPAHRYENLSRGKGWARKGKGTSAEWGERVDGGYRVGPGRWTVGASDGFHRKDEDVWNVEHIKMGDMTWTIAN
jgi:hypothetical protein